MTYLAFLARFILTPILTAALLMWTMHRSGRNLPASLRAWPAIPAVVGHVVLAMLYTAPWDNYLVAARVWWYDPALVSGLFLGYVPLEEYLFFAAQTILVGLWLLLAAQLALTDCRPFSPAARVASVVNCAGRSDLDVWPLSPGYGAERGRLPWSGAGAGDDSDRDSVRFRR